MSVKVKNVGDVAGDKVIQLYVARDYTSVSRPILELNGFKRVSLQPGEVRTDVFEVSLELLAHYDEDMRLVVEPGEYAVMIGRSSEDIVLKSRSAVVGDTKVYKSRRKFLSRSYTA